MHNRTVLERILGGFFGAALGGILTVSLFLSGTAHWVIYVPMALGALAGYWKGDRALVRMAKLLRWVGG